MRADRLLGIMLLLQSHGKMTTRQLAERFEVSRRTILRDINALSTAGVPIYAEGGHGGGVSLDDQYHATLAGMQENEIRTLFLGDNTAILREIGLGDAAERMQLKLIGAASPQHQSAISHMRQRILIDPTWWWHDEQPLPHWEQLQQAVAEDHTIKVVYERHNGETSQRVLEPYSLVAKSSVWYLVAQHNGDMRTYRVLRIRQLTLLENHFERDPHFDLPSYWRQQQAQLQKDASGYRFILHIRPDRMAVLREIVPGRFRVVQSDNRITFPAVNEDWITVEVRLETQLLAQMLVFGLKEGATVVEPIELRKNVHEAAARLLKTRKEIEAGRGHNFEDVKTEAEKLLNDDTQSDNNQQSTVNFQ